MFITSGVSEDRDTIKISVMDMNTDIPSQSIAKMTTTSTLTGKRVYRPTNVDEKHVDLSDQN